MDESLATGVPEAGMTLVSALDAALVAHGPSDKLENELKALEDVDMDMDIDVDVFRPSAMLDTRLDEEFGSSQGFGGLWHSDGDERGRVDLEQMLLSESDEELLGLLRQEQAEETRGLLRDPLRRRVFAIRAGRIATDGAGDAPELPPKYSSGVVAKVESGRAAFRHTFGERSQRFGFAGATCHVERHASGQAGAAVKTVKAPLEATGQGAPLYQLDPSLAQRVASSGHEEEDEDVDMEADDAVVPVSSNCSLTGMTVAIKQEVVIKDEPAVFKHEAVDVTPVTPARPQPIASAASSPEVFHTPLRRSMSSPSPSAFSSPPTADKTSFVSLDRMASVDGLGFAHGHSNSENDLLSAPQFRSMSPADELEKVAALHDTETLGKLGKVDASPTTQGHGSEEDQSEELKTIKSSESSGDRASIAVVVSGSPAMPLPPRYIKGPTDKEKRRVHSSTFQSFARSFSFSSVPSSSSALD